MKTPWIIFAVLLTCFTNLFAQHALVGTWELISTTGVNADGEKFKQDTTAVREIKIISPTHYILIAHDVIGDSVAFNRAYAGTIQLNGDKYIETPQMASLQIVENLKRDFTWKLHGNLFIQSGMIVRPDGKKVEAELTFRRVLSHKSYSDNPAIGTWDFVSTEYTNESGQPIFDKRPVVKVMEIITPTHWMGISYRNNKFENAMGGSYTFAGDKMYPEYMYSVWPMSKPKVLEIAITRTDNNLQTSGTIINNDGVKTEWKDLAERIGD